MKLIISTAIFATIYCVLGLIFNPERELISFLVGAFVASVIYFLAFYLIILHRKKEMARAVKAYKENVICSDVITLRKGILYNGGICYLLENKLVFETGLFSIGKSLTLATHDIISIVTRKIGVNNVLIRITSKTENHISFVISENSELLASMKQYTAKLTR